ncbi:DUF5104 domain-containing protein [Faecalicatena orotica]|uniref:DUF5104 domain-containing protein n=1 Tax=Faecalicatena orotica TaxID=1544 RepID=UPI00321774EC
MKKRVIQKNAIIMLLFSVCIGIGGCGIVFRTSSSRFPDSSNEEEIFQQTASDFFQAVDNRDKEAIKALFAPNVVKKDRDMDDMIEYLFDVYQEPIDSLDIEQGCSGSYSNDYGIETKEINKWFPVVSGDKNYYCYMTIVYLDDEDQDNVGIKDLVFLSEKEECNEDTVWPEGNGLHVIKDSDKEYLTRRIGYYPNVYTPMDRTITVEEILTFLEENDDWNAFVKQFGEPNSETCPRLTYAYELPDEGGEKRYAIIWVNIPPQSETGTIFKVEVVNDTDRNAISTPWETE